MPAAARQGDRNVPHCSPHTMAQGSPDVFINQRAACRQGDPTVPHLRPGSPCPGHSARVASGSGTVYINGKSAARVGDPLTSCTSIAQGSPDVFIG